MSTFLRKVLILKYVSNNIDLIVALRTYDLKCNACNIESANKVLKMVKE